jgi:cytochrome c5
MGRNRLPILAVCLLAVAAVANDTPSTPPAPGLPAAPKVTGQTVIRAEAVRPLVQPPAVPAPQALPEVPDPKALAFDSAMKSYDAKKGDTSAVFSFSVTNVSSHDVYVNAVRTSCGCTAAQLPAQPWKLAPGDHGPIGVTVDLHGKFGTINKTATLYTTSGMFPLNVRINIPMPDPSARGMGDRARNLQIAAADRQAVFKGDCATCHVTPALAKTGKPLFDAACGVCHEAPNRASMVPELHALKHPTDAAFWKLWIAEGKAGTLMPAFALKNGGILNDEQIQSLADYLEGPFKFDNVLNAIAPAPAAAPQPGPLAQ